MDRAIYTRMADHEDRHWWFVARRAILARLLERVTSKWDGPRILEVGCGTGGNLALLRRFGATQAVESDAWARQMAAERSGLDVYEGRLPDGLPAACARPDVVVLLDVLEHIEDDAGALEALAATLDANGMLLITVPALSWLWSAHDERHHHFRRYTASTLRARAEAAGFQVLDYGYFNTLLFPLLVAVRLIKRAVGSTSADDPVPSRPVNALLQAIFALERHLIGWVRLPIGASLFLVAKPVQVESRRRKAAV